MTSGMWIGVILAAVAIVVAGLVGYVLRTFAGYRAAARRLFADFVRRRHPELELITEGPPTVRLRRPGGETFAIDPPALYIRVNLADPAANEDLFEKLLTGYDSAAALRDKDAGV